MWNNLMQYRSIVLSITSSIMIICSSLMLLQVPTAVRMMGRFGLDRAYTFETFQLYFLFFSSNILTFIAGITGVIVYAKAKKSKVCSLMGIALILLYFATLMQDGLLWLSIFSPPTWVAIAIYALFAVSAYCIKNQEIPITQNEQEETDDLVEKRSPMLLATSITFIIFSTLMLLQLLLQTVFMAGALRIGGFAFQLMFLHWNTPVVLCVAILIAGIAGVINWEKPKKSEVCDTMGVFIIIIYCIHFLYQTFFWRSFHTVSFIEITMYVIYIASTYMFQEKKTEVATSEVALDVGTEDVKTDSDLQTKGEI